MLLVQCSGGLTFPCALLYVCAFISSVLSMKDKSEKVRVQFSHLRTQIPPSNEVLRAPPTHIDGMTIDNIILVGINPLDYVVGCFPFCL